MSEPTKLKRINATDECDPCIGCHFDVKMGDFEDCVLDPERNYFNCYDGEYNYIFVKDED